eukprot:TRINITY_DN10807_c0_g1_i2.p2 TRINITY_DN10807_c0_g1~~TRINITY_DN10807_c0_g1_i2.p2  ORF type:complete len:100 (+),score=7.76 TRINITY_DN10807_c0_g1_i2:338-637(+)
MLESILLVQRRSMQRKTKEEDQANKLKAPKKARASSAKCFALRDLLDEIEERGIKISNPLTHPHSELTTNFIKEQLQVVPHTLTACEQSKVLQLSLIHI